MCVKSAKRNQNFETGTYSRKSTSKTIMHLHYSLPRVEYVSSFAGFFPARRKQSQIYLTIISYL